MIKKTMTETEREQRKHLTEQMLQWWKQVEKKITGKPEPLQILQRRTMNTAMAILDGLLGIPYASLSASLYFYCADAGMVEFTRQFEAQIELAGANPERFFKQLHQFLTQIGKKIKKEKLLREYAEYMHVCFRLKQESDNRDKINEAVVNAYLNLLLQVTEYIRPTQFDLNQLVCGVSTDGEPLTMQDPFPMLDMGGYLAQEVMRELIQKGVPLDDSLFDQIVRESYRKFHYEVKGHNDVEQITNANQAHSGMIAANLPLINEYTWDMLPIKPFSTIADQMLRYQGKPLPWDLLELLKKRSRTLPTNGLEIRFAPGLFYRKLFLKEICYRWHIYALYRYETSEGDITGFIDTKTGTFYTAILKESMGDIYRLHRDLTLFCYASHVLDHPDIQLPLLPEHFREWNAPVTGEAVLHGGKLRDHYHKEGKKTGPRDGDQYTREDRTIQGFIRTLPPGQSPSERAIAAAESLGYHLSSHETYVQPFTRQVIKLKAQPPTKFPPQ